MSSGTKQIQNPNRSLQLCGSSRSRFIKRRNLIRIKTRLMSATSNHYPNAEKLSHLTASLRLKKMVRTISSNTYVGQLLTAIRTLRKVQSEMIFRLLSFARSKSLLQLWPYYRVTRMLQLASKVPICKVVVYREGGT